MSDRCLNCSGLIMEPGKNYGYSGKVCYCRVNPVNQYQQPASKEYKPSEPQVSLHDKPQAPKPREWWIDSHWDAHQFRYYAEENVPHETDKIIHVIEYSAYELSQTRLEHFQKLHREFAAEVQALRSERDDFKEAYNEQIDIAFDYITERDEARAELEHRKAANQVYVEENDELRAQADAYKSTLEKIVEAERMGYGTQRTYGEMAAKALADYKSQLSWSLKNEEQYKQALAQLHSELGLVEQIIARHGCSTPDCSLCFIRLKLAAFRTRPKGAS